MIAVSAELTSPSLGLVSTGMRWARCVYNVNARMFTCMRHLLAGDVSPFFATVSQYNAVFHCFVITLSVQIYILLCWCSTLQLDATLMLHTVK